MNIVVKFNFADILYLSESHVLAPYYINFVNLKRLRCADNLLPPKAGDSSILTHVEEGGDACPEGL